jgi:HK97 family phage portal protein
MRLFGLEITRAKSAPASYAPSERGWWPIVREPFAGAWQQNREITVESVLTHSAVYACITLIASDIAKMRLRLVQQDANNIWTEATSDSFTPVLRRPNRYQNRIQFIFWWLVSKLTHGNAYVLKARDDRKVVVGLYLLDPLRTKVCVAPDGSVFYELSGDTLSGIGESVTVPASEIIHDVMNPLYHPLCGVSPITACWLAASQGLAIQRNSAKFFQNGSQPSGILTAPHHIEDDTAKRLKDYWEENFTGPNAGRTAVLGDGLKYEAMSVNAVDAQLVEQLKWSDETVCRVFHVPPYKVGVGEAPSYNNIEALDRQYYSQCLQIHIESIELCLDEGLGIGVGAPKAQDGRPPAIYGTEFDLDDLLRMDSATLYKTLGEGIKGSILKPNEARRKLGFGPVEGGDAVLAQQQDFSLAALAERDANDPFSKPEAGPPATPPTPAEEPKPETDDDSAAKRAQRSRGVILAFKARMAEHDLAA